MGQFVASFRFSVRIRPFFSCIMGQLLRENCWYLNIELDNKSCTMCCYVYVQFEKYFASKSSFFWKLLSLLMMYGLDPSLWLHDKGTDIFSKQPVSMILIKLLSLVKNELIIICQEWYIFWVRCYCFSVNLCTCQCICSLLLVTIDLNFQAGQELGEKNTSVMGMCHNGVLV
jgi:hypothetical protein